MSGDRVGSVRNGIDGGTFYGTVVQAGTVRIAGRLPAVSGYVHQVRRLSAALLVGRESELADTSAFCTASNGPVYLRWQAPAWAGKTALLAEFVLHPPRGIRVVSFFVTSRLARQNDRVAFCEVVQRQLYEILGEEVPAATEYTLDEQFLHALDRAACLCAERGERLVLVVDGLDEDRGVTVGPDSHSIAALLPARPAGGMRIIVAGRPNPPVPDDVPAGHPLRQERGGRSLSTSRHAEAVRGDMERELSRLLACGGVEQDLLGLVAASGGGLSAQDLATLAGCSAWTVRRHLDSVAGRTFRSRTTHWAAAAADVYLLGHEELQQHALHVLASDLPGYRDRLHRWAESYEDRGWPQETPEYLLRGYTQLLEETRDTRRLLRLASNHRRHERLLAVSGDDLAALTEIARTQGLLLSTEAVDLEAMLLLSLESESLEDRNSALPEQLLALWARLGHRDRAVNLARATADPFERVTALGTVLRHLTASTDDHPGFAASVADEALSLARVAVRPAHRDAALASVCGSLAAAGRVALALDTASGLAAEREGAWATAEVADVLAKSGDLRRALDLVAGISDPVTRVSALVEIALTTAQAPDRQPDLADQAVDLLPSLCDPWLSPEALVEVATGLAKLGRLQPAIDLLCRRPTPVSALQDADLEDDDLADLVLVLAHGSEHERALTLVDRLSTAEQRGQAVTDIACALADAGRADEARRLAEGIPDPGQQSEALADVAGAWARAGRFDEAVDLADGLVEPAARVRSLTGVAHILTDAGLIERATDLAQQATDTARNVFDAHGHARALADIARALARSGHHHEAVALVSHTTDLLPEHETGWPADRSVSVLETLTSALIVGGDHTGAVDLARKAAAFVEAMPDPDRRDWPASRVAVLLAELCVDHEALDLADTIDEPERKLITLAKISAALADRGETAAARELAAVLVESLDEEEENSVLTAHAALCLLRAGCEEEALGLVERLSAPVDQMEALTDISTYLLSSGHADQAHQHAQRAVTILREQNGLVEREDFAVVLVPLIAAEDLGTALALTTGMPTPARRSRALTDIVSVLSPAGHAATIADLLDQAQGAVGGKDGRDAAIIARIAVLRARSGDHRGAIGLARDLDPESRAGALAALAGVMGPTPASARLCAEAVHLRGWRTVLDVLGAVAPAALITLGRLALTRAVAQSRKDSGASHRSPAPGLAPGC